MKKKLILGDCINRMAEIPDNSIDMVLTDPPYGTTKCKWDNIIPYDKMWEQLNRITKPQSVICLFGSEPFSSQLRLSNIKNFKYDWIWDKRVGSNFATVKYQPFKTHEMVSVFYQKSGNYYPIKEIRTGQGLKRLDNQYKSESSVGEVCGVNLSKRVDKTYEKLKYPSSVKYFNPRESNRGLHPTQKPVSLLEYLIKTYTKENHTVLDFAMGSGSTGVACSSLNRNFIGIENDECYYKITKLRMIGKIEEARKMRKSYGK